MFLNRVDAGTKLARSLAKLKGQHPIVYALPRGGVPVAAEIAMRLQCPLDVLFVRKIGHPRQPELALGAVVDGDRPLVVRNENIIAASGVDDEEFNRLAAVQLAEIVRRKALYGKGSGRASPKDRVTILVDDGIATGATAKAGMRALRHMHARKVILAIPVAARDSMDELKAEADEVVCLERADWFPGVGAFYVDFAQVTDEEVMALLAKAHAAQGQNRREDATPREK